MLVAVVGGNLQGVEATYLARKAGWEVILIDKNSNAPAMSPTLEVIPIYCSRQILSYRLWKTSQR
jgi:heterodisulfide reductase subunit A-like polyferredoxin